MPFFINQAKFNEEDILWIPVSGLTGLNITRPVDPQECSWY